MKRGARGEEQGTGNGEQGRLLIRGGRVIDPSQQLDRVADVYIEQGRVAWVSGRDKPSATPKDCLVFDATGLVVTPGFVDLHTHLREPGFEEKETIATGTRSAARGGFTTICCMPNTNPPIDSKALVEFVLRKAASEGVVMVLVVGCVTKGRAGKELAEMGEMAQAGAVAFSDDGSPVRRSDLMRNALTYSGAFGLPVIDHCEDPQLANDGVMHEGWVSAQLGLRGIPAAAEEVMVARDIALAELTGGHAHIAHLSTAGSAELVRQAKAKGLRVTAEVTPHHLLLTHERVLGDGRRPNSAYDTSAKVNPPLRTREDNDALVAALRDGVIDAIATDHAPHTLLDKQCEYDLAAFGISGFETALASLLGLVHQGELPLATLVERLTVGPARVLSRDGEGLGTLRTGAPGDVCVFDPDAAWTIRAADFASKGKNTPLDGEQVKGKVIATVVGGNIVYQAERTSTKGARS